jgi:putative hydrolase of the HAD superfamily
VTNSIPRTVIPKPRAVLFDLFHTLVTIPKAEGEFGPTAAASLGIPHAHAEFQRRMHEDDVLGRCLGHVLDPHDVMRRLAHHFDPTISDERVADAVKWRRKRIEHGLLRVETAVLAALDRLRAAGVRTALVSDAGFDDVECWDRSPLVERLDAAVFSFEIGIRKPDRRIYERALAAIDVDPRDALFVGDGGSDEHRGARALGMRAVMVTRYYAYWDPAAIAERRPHADFEFEDVPAFVDAVDL